MTADSMRRSIQGKALWILLFALACSHGPYDSQKTSSNPDPKVEESTEPTKVQTWLEIRGVADFDRLLRGSCEEDRWVSYLTKSPPGNASDPARLTLYVGEREPVAAKELWATQNQLIFSMVDQLKLDGAVLSEPLFNYGTSHLARKLKRASGPWILDWMSDSQSPWTESRRTNILTIRVQSLDFRNELPVYADHPVRRQGKPLRRQPLSMVSGRNVLVVRVTEASKDQIPKLLKNTIGLAVVVGNVSDDTVSELRDQGWAVVPKDAELFKIHVEKTGRAQFTAVSCSDLPSQPSPISSFIKRERAQALKGVSKVLWSKGSPVTLSDLKHENPETPSGNSVKGYWFAEVLRTVAHAQFALLPSYWVQRGDLRSGALKPEDVWQSIPFDERLFLVDMKGRDLRRALTIHAGLFSGDGKSPFPFFYAGKKVVIEYGDKGPVVEVSSIADDQYYKIVLPGSILGQSKLYLGQDYFGMATELRFRFHRGMDIFASKYMKGFPKSAGFSVLTIRGRQDT